MIKTTVQIEGMACGMCEAHINDAIRAAFPVRKVRSSHEKGVTEIISETEISKDALRSVIDQTGYKMISASSES